MLGVGNELNGDDAAGLLTVRALKKYLVEDDQVLVLETGPAPENFTSAVTRFHPDWVLVVDAARLGYMSGVIACIDLDEVSHGNTATHGITLSMLGRYLVTETSCRFTVLGIQVGQTGFDEPMTPSVERAALRVTKAIHNMLH